MFIIFKDITYKFFLLLLLSLYCFSSTIWINDPSDESEICPNGCQCENYSVECKHRLFPNVPIILQEKTTRLNLLGNRINVIRKSDFFKLIYLKVLQLSNNRITSIEPGAFDNLVNLIKLRLNRNLIQYLPDGLFSKLSKLQKLDLRDNQLQCINENTFNKLTMLKYLLLEGNKIFWISESIKKLKNLKELRIKKNKLTCNCHLAWLNWLMKHRPDIFKPDVPSVVCSAPFRLSDIPVYTLSPYEFQCASEDKTNLENICQQNKKVCSKQCNCSNDGIVKCVGKQLSNIPQDLPVNVVELDLSDNNITILQQGYLSKYKTLKKINLTGNGMVDIEPGAFLGLQQLTSLYLNSNKLKTIRKNAFSGLSSLMFLFLHGNEIECLPADAFEGVKKLHILHLSENKLTTLKRETFNPLIKLRFLYIVNNPLNCDCRLAWIVDYIKGKENNEPIASCHYPRNMQGLALRSLQTYSFQCNNEFDSKYETHNEECVPKVSCPLKCTCTSDIVNCSNTGLNSLPSSIFPSTKTLIMSHNNLNKLTPIYSVHEAPNLMKLDLSFNQIEKLDADVFSRSTKLTEIHLNSNKLKCINNETFKNLNDLRTLQLSDNEINCIVVDSFKNNLNLKYLMLNKNPFHCNCNMKWMSEWSRNHHSTLGDHRLPTCHSPGLLKGTPITHLDEKYFLCDGNASIDQSFESCSEISSAEACCSIGNDECKQIKKCPLKCKCEITKVDCSDMQLKEIPHEIPLDTTELYLDRNDLKTLNETSFKNLVFLKTLVLSYNGITELNKNVLTPLKTLETLVLSFNKLQCIHQDAFKDLRNLKVLILQSNDVSTIPFQAFNDLKNLNNIALGQNPFHCDCNIKWLNQFFLERFLDNGISLCASPEKMKLKSIYHSKPTDFICSEETEDAYITAKCDGCMKRPCKHNGKCSLITHHNYQCDCPYPFHGKNCENKINACFGQPCRNGGICKNIDNFGNYECVCPLGFRGPKCTLNIDDCVAHRCINGECVDLRNSYSCKCQNGFRGEYCDVKFSYCNDINPCKNDGVCQSLPNNDYKCICSKGWEGKECDQNIDDCKYNTCKHEAKCIDLHNDYKCSCRPGYVGKYCEQPAWKPTSKPVSRRYINESVVMIHSSSENEIISESVCAYHECLNNGICVNGDQSKNQRSYCRCKPGFSGHLCQYLNSIYFHKNSHIEITPPSRGFLMPKGNISLNFLTNSTSGLLLYQGFDQTYLVVNLYQGHVRISYNLGDKVVGPEGYSMGMVNDSKLHKLHIEIVGENLTMYLNGRVHCTLKSKFINSNRYMALDTGIFIGGAPTKILQSAMTKYHIDTDSEFIGCIESLLINQKRIDFSKYLSRSINVKPGCGDILSTVITSDMEIPSINQYSTKFQIPVTRKKLNNPCRRPGICKNQGICEPIRGSKKKFRCICKNGYVGKRCKKRTSMCHGTFTENFIDDPDTLDSCKSMEKFQYRSCVGACSNNKMQSDVNKGFFHKPIDISSSRCCQPTKYSTHKIQFKCRKGRTYFRDVNLPKNCKCVSNCQND